MVGEEADISRELNRADIWTWAVPPSNTTQQLPLDEGRYEGWDGGRG